MNTRAHALRFDAAHGAGIDMRAEVCAGLARRPKQLPSKYFYDAKGSALFEAICIQPEYYLTRAELALMRRHVAAIASALGPEVLLLEYGSGAGIKTRMLLAHLEDPVAYVPIEISSSALRRSVARLRDRLPAIEVLPVCADFTRPLMLPTPRRRPRRRVIYFPGSTIGNFDSASAVGLLRRMRAEMGDDGAALVGADLIKDPAMIEAAYNDAAGVTARFTLNMLVRLNRELGADFDLSAFSARSRYNAPASRIEAFIVSRRSQDVRVSRRAFHFDAAESMLVEISCKYSHESFARLGARAGLRVARVWEDPEHLFSLQLLVNDGSAPQ